MFKKVIKFIFVLFIFVEIVFIFSFSNLWKESSIETIKLWLYKVVLSIVPIYILSSLLLAIPSITNFIFKFFRRFHFFENEKALMLFCLSFLTGSPTSSILVKKAYLNKEITLEQANKLFVSSSHVSFLFVFMIFEFKIAFILVISQIIASFILYFFKANFSEYHSSGFTNNILDTINLIIDDLPLMLLKILSSMLIITLIKFPFSFFNIKFISIILDYLEVTTGIVNFINLNLNFYFKIILFSSILSINGGAILLQIFNVVKKTKLNFRRFLVMRFIHAIISSIISLILMSFFYL